MDTLPEEIVLQILQYLPANDVTRCLRLNKYFNSLLLKNRKKFNQPTMLMRVCEQEEEMASLIVWIRQTVTINFHKQSVNVYINDWIEDFEIVRTHHEHLPIAKAIARRLEACGLFAGRLRWHNGSYNMHPIDVQQAYRCVLEMLVENYALKRLELKKVVNSWINQIVMDVISQNKVTVQKIGAVNFTNASEIIEILKRTNAKRIDISSFQIDSARTNSRPEFVSEILEQTNYVNMSAPLYPVSLKIMLNVLKICCNSQQKNISYYFSIGEEIDWKRELKPFSAELLNEYRNECVFSIRRPSDAHVLYLQTKTSLGLGTIATYFHLQDTPFEVIA